MKIINPFLIKQCITDSGVYNRGNSLFMDEGVRRIELKGLKNGNYEILAKVRGSSGFSYNTSVIVDFSGRDASIQDYQCECRAFAQYPGMCKHIVAMLAEYNYQAQDGTFDQHDDFEGITFQKANHTF